MILIKPDMRHYDFSRTKFIRYPYSRMTKVSFLSQDELRFAIKIETAAARSFVGFDYSSGVCCR